MPRKQFSRACFGAGVVAMLLAGSAIAQAPNPEQAKQQITAAIEGLVRASQNNDMAAMDKYYAPDATLIDSSGESKWSEYKERHLRDQLATIAKANHRVVAMNIQVWGDTALATYDFVIAVKPEAARAAFGEAFNPAAAKTSEVAGGIGLYGKGTAVFRHINNEWKVVHVQATGRPMKPAETARFSPALAAPPR